MSHEDDEMDTDDVITRDRFGRASFFFLCAFVALFGPAAIILPVLNLFLPLGPLPTIIVIVASIVAGGQAFAPLVPNFFVMVPQVQGFVTLNPLLSTFGIRGNPNIIYGPGLHFAYPWEQRSRKSNFSLEVFTSQLAENVQGKETELLVEGSYQYAVDLRLSDRFIGIDEATIKGGALDLIKARISSELAEQTGDTAKRDILKYNKELYTYFGLDKPAKKAEARVADTEEENLPTRFEHRYGLSSKAVTISSIDFPEDVKRTRNAKDEAKQAIQGVAYLYGMEPEALVERLKNGSLPINVYNEMLDRFAAFSGNANMTIQGLKLHGLDGVADALARILASKNGG